MISPLATTSSTTTSTSVYLTVQTNRLIRMEMIAKTDKEIFQDALAHLKLVGWRRGEHEHCAAGAIATAMGINSVKIYNLPQHPQLKNLVQRFNGNDRYAFKFNDEIAESFDDIEKRFNELIAEELEVVEEVNGGA